jgi:hypothetical protein
MLCIPKTGKLRTVFDKRLQNDNTVKNVTPFPDQDMICNDVTRSNHRLKIDLTDVYEQVHQHSLPYMYGTYESLVMQQGDCNAPSTFQCLMTWILIKQVGRCIHIYLDDIFIFSMSLGDHEKHLGEVFLSLWKTLLCLSQTKVDLYSKWMECLGNIIDGQGIHADTDRLY